MPNVRPLSKELQEVAISELNEDPAKVDSSLAAIKTWLQMTPHIKARMDDQFLLSFLRGCKFSLEKTKSKLDSFYTIRTAIPDLFANRVLSDQMIELFKQQVIVPLPKTDGPAGPRIILIRFLTLDFEKFKFHDIYKLWEMVEDIFMAEDDNLVVSGAVYVMDMKDFSMKLASYYTPSFVKKISTVFQDAKPFRIKGLHVFNPPSIITPIYDLFKGFFNDKISSRMGIHDSLEKLCEIIPQNLLPNEYGGSAGTLAEINDEWVKKLKSYEKHFEEDNKYGTDESLRVGKPKNAETLFGVDGSFRKLAVD